MTNSVMSATLLAQAAETDTIEQQVDGLLEGPVTWFSNIIFFPITIGEVSFPFVVLWLIVAASVFTVYMGFIQFRGFGVALEAVRGKFSTKTDPGEISHFQALSSAVSGTVGLGNIAGVGLAVAMGGPGATFWMICAGLLGMASKFTECTLGVKFREIDENGVVHGGPFKYLPIAFKVFSKPVAKVLTGVFAIAIMLFGVAGGGMFQSNQALAQVVNVTGGEESFFAGGVGSVIFGLVLIVLVGLIIIGGMKSIGRVTDKLVPTMAILYVASCLIVILGNIGHVPAAIGEIIGGAFSPQGVAGGVIGCMVIGFQRAAFSNEAGIGSSPIVHATVKTRRPVSEGFVAMLEPFLDTVVVCSMTALTIIIANAPSYGEAQAVAGEGWDGVTLVSDAFATITPWWPILLTVAVILFAFSTLITWAYYGEKAWQYLFGRATATGWIYKIILFVFIMIGCLATFTQVVNFSDAALFACAFINMLGLYIMMPVVKREMKAFLAERKSGELYKLGIDGAVPYEDANQS